MTVTVAEFGVDKAIATTDDTGSFTFALPASPHYTVSVAKTGYVPETYQNVAIAPGTRTFLEPILQFDFQAATGNGGATGTIVNAVNGQGLSGLDLALRRGINATLGSVLLTTTTGAGGIFSLATIPAGNYTAEISGPGFTTNYFTITILGGFTTNDANGSVTPNVQAGETRIVLTWGQFPVDLDSHLTGPTSASESTRFHVYYSDRSFPREATGSVELDLDDTSSYGPETTTIYKKVAGVYRFYVQDFSSQTATHSVSLANSGAKVKVYQGSGLVAAFAVPTDLPGSMWTVFEIEGASI